MLRIEKLNKIYQNFLKLFRAVYESLFTKKEKKRKGEEQDYRDSQTWFLGEGWTSRHVKRWVWSKGSFSFYPVLSGDLRIYVKEIYAVWRERQAKETIK